MNGMDSKHPLDISEKKNFTQSRSSRSGGSNTNKGILLKAYQDLFSYSSSSFR